MAQGVGSAHGVVVVVVGMGSVISGVDAIGAIDAIDAMIDFVLFVNGCLVMGAVTCIVKVKRF